MGSGNIRFFGLFALFSSCSSSSSLLLPWYFWKVRFTWALRQFNFCSILIGTAPNVAEYKDGTDAARADFANRSGKLVALAGESFNDGLRGFYFAIAAMTWFVQPAAFMVATTVVVAILYFREFHSSALHAIIGR